MIERHWKMEKTHEGAADLKSASQAGGEDAHEKHLKTETFVQLPAIAGFAGARILRREVGAGTEFLVITEKTREDAADPGSASHVGGGEDNNRWGRSGSLRERIWNRRLFRLLCRR